MNAKPTLYWGTEWQNGCHTILVTYSTMATEVRADIERIADEHGFCREDNRWTPPEHSLGAFFEAIRGNGYVLEFEKDDPGAPYNMQRLKLEPTTRSNLEALRNFILADLFGYCPVQADGQIYGLYWYFRARGSYWRMEIGGNESGSRAPSWWHEEDWPSADGFAAGYLTDEEAIGCILRAVDIYRTGDRSRFEKGHPDYERTVLEGWACGALRLSRVVKRSGMSGAAVIERAKFLGIELPYFADRELKKLDDTTRYWSYDRACGEWIEVEEEGD